LIRRISASSISSRVNVYHSGDGKLNVVRGALSDRANLDEVFVSDSRTAANYGFVVKINVDNPPPRLKHFVAKAWELQADLISRRPETDFRVITYEPDGCFMKVIEYRIIKASRSLRPKLL